MRLASTAKILIVDDLPALVTGLRRALGQLGFTNVIEAANGEEALALLQGNNDTVLVISDWNMEPMDGLALLKALRADARFAKLPFILASAEANADLRRRANTAGVSLILPKPFDVAALRTAIADLAD
jgi:two-component system chemotaxis response regulator CheY